MRLDKIPPIENGLINVIIETPKNCQNKFDYDKEFELFRLKKTLPMGTLFPFDFGFIPNTIAEDGDPLDVLVIMDQHAFTGCLLSCRIIGVIEAEQVEKNKQRERNDRIVAVNECSILYKDITKIKELNKKMVTEIENFFIDYNKHENKKFIPLKWSGIQTAKKLIAKCSTFSK